MSFTVLLEQRLLGDKHYVLLFSVCPIGAKTARNFTFTARDYATDDETDRKMLDFNELVI